MNRVFTVTFDMVYCYLSEERNINDEQAEDVVDKLFKKLKKDKRFKNVTQKGFEEEFEYLESNIEQINLDYKEFEYDFNEAFYKGKI